MIIYVASPYMVSKAHRQPLLDTGYRPSDLDALVRHRVKAAEEACANLQYEAHSQGLKIWFYTPIGYETLIIDSLPYVEDEKKAAYTADADYWLDLDFRFLGIADAMIILALPGYSASSGIAAEYKLFSSMIAADISILHYTSQCPATRAVHHINSALRSCDRPMPGVPAYLSVHDLVRHYR